MRYLLIHTADPDVGAEWDENENWAAFSSWQQEAVRSGVTLQGTRLRPTADATTVKIRDGELVITDGPYAETKEQIAGYDVLECADLDETIEVASRHPMARLGILEVRPFWPLKEK